ncbi:hypothetical protein J3B01_003833 [Coemansia erecta]|nr:hypothetical protein J3B01_003833 [Coemansia erecta]
MSEDLSPAAQFAAAVAAEASAAAAAVAAISVADAPVVAAVSVDEAEPVAAVEPIAPAEPTAAEPVAVAEPAAEVSPQAANDAVPTLLSPAAASEPTDISPVQEVTPVSVPIVDAQTSAAAAFESAVGSAVASNSDSDRAPAPRVRKPIDLADEELFPALGKPASASAAPTPWGGPKSMATQLRQNRVTEALDLPMMESSVAAAVRAIAERSKTAIEVSHNRSLKTSTYLVSGRPEAVARAKREICAKLSPQVTRVVQVPALVRAQIAGVRGRNLQEIQTQTHTVIVLPKAGRDESPFEVLDVSITGDHSSVIAAAQLIEAIVDKRTTKRAVRITDVPRELHALLVGQDGATLQALEHAHAGVQISIPGPLDADAAIGVVGERDVVQAAVAEIRATAHALLQSSRTVTVTVPKRQHQFIIGPGGQTLREIVRSTGCSVNVPPPRSPSDQVTVRGADAALMQALSLVKLHASSVAVETVNPSTIHTYARPMLYVRRALQYFHDRNRFRRIESEHGVELRVPSVAQAAAAQTPEQVLIEVQGRDARAVTAAKDAVCALFAAFPPFHFNGIDVEPHLHSLLTGDGGTVARLQAARSIYTLFPKDTAARDILVVYEGFNPDIDRVAPEAREDAVRALLRKTLEEFRQAISNDDSYATVNVDVPVSLQRSLNSAQSQAALFTAANISGRVVLRFGAAPDDSAEAESTRVRRRDDSQLSENEVQVKGLTDDVQKIVAELNLRVAKAADYERLHSFRDQVAVPQQMLARIIGRGGENIRRIRSERDVTIDVVDGTNGASALVKLQGTQQDVAAVAAELYEFIERLADQTAETISVQADIHRALIGSGGRYVKRLEEKYAVRIAFPSSRRDDDDSSPLAADQIRIRGGRKGVDDAKVELLELAAYEVEHNHTVRFSVPAAALPHIVGKAGVRISEIKDESDTRIDLGDPSEGNVEVTVIGTRKGANAARTAIEAIVAEQESQVDVVLEVPTKHHRFLIGSGGARVRELVTQAGGNPDIMTGPDSCRIQFPRASDKTDSVRIKGDRAIVDAVRLRIEALVAERERMTTVSVSIPVSQHAFIIGRGGAQLKQLQDTHSVEIHFRSKVSRSTSDDPSAVNITGLPEACEACKAALLALVRDESTITVPLALHLRLGGRTGSLWRRIRNEFDVQVDAVRVDKAPAYRIDEANDSDESTVYRDTSSNLSGLSADWVLRGETSKLALVADLINREITNAESAVEARLRIEPRLHRHIIGKQGSTIASIRDATGCEVTVPKRGSSSQWVSVTGTRSAVDQAIELVNQAVEERA